MTEHRSIKRRKRYWIWLAAALLPGLIIYAALVAHGSAPDYYAKPRAALTTARQHLQLAYGEGQALREDLAIEHREIEMTLQALQQARLAGEGRTRVSKLATRVRRLEQPDELGKMTPQQLRREYESILADLQRLIDQNH